MKVVFDLKFRLKCPVLANLATCTHVEQLFGFQRKQTSKQKLLGNVIKYTPSRLAM